MSANFNIREACPDDAEAACDVLRRSITELCQLDYEGVPGRLDQWLANKTTAHVRGWIKQTGFTFYLADQRKRIIGVAGMNNLGMVLLNYVDPDDRFQGVSAALLGHMEKRARTLGLTEVKLESSKTALPFYKARGYRNVSGEQGLWLSKPLIRSI